jgi:hypothetical protein
MTPKHAYRARRIGVALILAAMFCIPGIPGRPGIMLLTAALVLFGATALYAATHHNPPAPIGGPSPAAHNAAALASTLATLIDIHREHQPRPADVAHAPVLDVPMRPDWKDLRA